MKRYFKRLSINAKIIFMIFMGCTLLTVCALFASNSIYRRSTNAYYSDYTIGIAKDVQQLIDGDAVENYYEQLLALDKSDVMYGIKVLLLRDAEYNEMLRELENIRDMWSATYIYVCNAGESSGVVIMGASEDEYDTKRLGYEYADDEYSVGLTGGMTDNISAESYTDETLGDICVSRVPVRNSEGEITAQIFAAKELEMMMGSESIFAAQLGGVMMAVTILVMALMYLFIRRSLIKPLAQLSAAAENCYTGDELAATDPTGVTADDIMAQAEPIFSLKLKNNDEIAALHESIKKMNLNLRDSVNRLHDKWWESEHDPLTTLGNRALLERRMKGEYKRLRSVLVCFIDLSGLKFINDNYNHDAGNNVIRRAAAEIKSITNDRIHGYRYGGDEFLVIVCNAERDIDMKMMRSWSESVGVLNRATDKIKCTIAMGCEYAEGDFTVADCINKADANMYEIKRTDKNSRMYYDLNKLAYPTDKRDNAVVTDRKAGIKSDA